MAAGYGTIDGDRPDQEDQNASASEVVEMKTASSLTGRWFTISVVALLVIASVFLVTGSSSSSSMVAWVSGNDPPNMQKYVPLALHKTTTKDEETAVDTTVWAGIGSWLQNGLGSEYYPGKDTAYSALGGSDDLNTLYVSDANGYLKVSTNGGSSFTTTRPFTYSYGGSYKNYVITQMVVAGASPSIAYAATWYGYAYGGGNLAGKILKTTDSGATWTAVSPSTSKSTLISYNGVATSSTGQYVLTVDSTATYSAYVSKDYGSTYSVSYTLSSSYPFRACAVSSSGQYMYIVSDDYLFIHSSYGSTSGSWGYKYYYGISNAYASATKISVSSTGDKILIIGKVVLFSSDRGATLTTLSPTDTKYSSSMTYSIIDAQISPDGSTVAVIQSGAPALYSYGSNEAYIRYSPNPASGASATWSTLYPPTVGQYSNNWFVKMFRFNTAGEKVVTVSPTSYYYDSLYRVIWRYGNGWTGSTAAAPTAAPTLPVPTMKPTPVPTHTPAPSAMPTLAPTNKPIASTPSPTNTLSPTAAQLTGKLTGKRGTTFNFESIASTSEGVLFAAYKGVTASTGNNDRRTIYMSSDGVSWYGMYNTKSAYVGCSSGTISGLKAAYNSVYGKYIFWYICGPTSGSTPIININVCISTYADIWECKTLGSKTSAFNSAFATVGASAVSSDGLKYAFAGQQGGLVIVEAYYDKYNTKTISNVWSRFNDVGSPSTSTTKNKYGGLAWSSDGAYLLVAPNNGLSLWYVTVPVACFRSTPCYLDTLTKTTSPSLPASESGTTGTWTSCVADSTKNYMACTQYGGYTYYSTNKGVSWSKVGTKTTYIKTLAMYSTSSGKACIAGVSTYGSPYLMTNTDGQSTTEWVTQTIGNTNFGKGFYDVTVTSCSNIYATAIGGDTDNNILVTSGTFSETDSTTTEDSVIADTTDYNWTWGSLSTTTETAYSAIAASSDSIYIYAASTNSTIGVSSDGGNSWTTASGPGTADWSDISCSSNGQYITVVSFAGDIWTSTDFGATWNSDILIEQDTLISVAVSDDGATVFLGGNNGAYLSIDSGGGYTEVPTSDYINSSLTYGFKVAGSSDGSVLIAASAFGGILSSNDTGETWAFFDSNTTFSSVKYANGIVYAASTEDGLYSSTDNGATWTMFDAAPQEEEWKTIAVSSDGTFIAAAASFELISVSDDAGATWGTIGTGDMWTDLVFVSGGKVLLSTSEGKTKINQAIYSDSSSSSSSLRGSKKSSSKKSSSKKSSSKKSSSSSSKKSSSKKSSGK